MSTDNDRFLSTYIDNGWAQKLDKSLIPNIENLVEAQASPPFDPNREYTLPWFSGMDGIAWNEDVSGPVTSVTQLLEDPDLKGKVGVWNSMGDTLGLVMLENGDDPAKVTDETFDRALAVIQKAQDAGQIRRFYGNDYAQPLARGDLAASMAWSGDILNLGDPKIKWGIAEKGGIIWTDNMLVPLGGSVPTASTYMNFVYDPKIAAELALGANYISSVKGVKDEASNLNPDAAANTLASRPTTCSRRCTRTTRRCSPTRTTKRGGWRSRASKPTQMGSFLHRHKGLTPYLLLAPGILWLAIFFAIPLGFLGYQSLQSGLFPNFEFTWEFSNFSDGIRDYHEQFVRSFVYAGIATLACFVLAFPLVYWIAFRAGPWRNLFLLFIIAPFFVTYLVRTLAWLNILADEGPVVGLLRDLHVLGPDGRLLATTFAVSRASPTTSSPSWPYRSTSRSSRSTHACSRRQRISTRLLLRPSFG